MNLGYNAECAMANEVISYLEMCAREGTSLQRGMNFGLGGDHSVVLMSVRSNAPYRDRLEDEGTISARAYPRRYPHAEQ